MTTAIAAALQTVTSELASEFGTDVLLDVVDAAVADLTADELADIIALDLELQELALHELLRPVFFTAASGS